MTSLWSMVDAGARWFEGAGALVMLVGAVLALGLTVRHRAAGPSAMFRDFRHRLGRVIVLGLELLIAADILRTISRDATLADVAVLGAIVLVRTFLSFTLAVELEGRWPWQSRPT